MKTILITIFTLFSMALFAQDQKQYYLSAGASLNNAPGDLTDNVGFYAGFGATGELSESTGFLGEVQFVNQRQVSSLVGTFAYRVIPNDKFSLHLGFQLAMHIYSDWPTEGIDKPDGGRIDGVVGVQYNIGKKLGLLARYSHTVNDIPVKGMAQIGATWRLK